MYFSHDEVADREGDRGTRFLSAFSVDGATLLGQETQNLLIKSRSWCSEAQEGVDVGSVLLGRCWGRRKADIEREAKRTINSRDTANDIGAIDGAAVPCVSGSVGCYHENGIGATIIGSDGDSFIQELMKMLDANSLVVASSTSNMNIVIEDAADLFDETFERTAVVDNEQSTKANFQKDVLDEKSSEVMGADVIGGSNNEDKTGEITHRIHKIGFATIVSNFAWAHRSTWTM